MANQICALFKGVLLKSHCIENLPLPIRNQPPGSHPTGVTPSLLPNGAAGDANNDKLEFEGGDGGAWGSYAPG